MAFELVELRAHSFGPNGSNERGHIQKLLARIAKLCVIEYSRLDDLIPSISDFRELL